MFEGQFGVLNVADGFESAFFECESGDGAYAVDISDGEGAQEFDFVLVWDEGETVGFFVIAAEFCEELVGGDADAGGEMPFATDSLFQINCGREGEAEGFVGLGSFGDEVADVEVGFVNGHLFYERREFGKHGHYVMRFIAIRIHSRADENGVGTEPVSGAGGHGRSHLESPRLVAGSADDAALIGR